MADIDKVIGSVAQAGGAIASLKNAFSPSGFIVVSQSWSAFISPSPLYL